MFSFHLTGIPGPAFLSFTPFCILFFSHVLLVEVLCGDFLNWTGRLSVLSVTDLSDTFHDSDLLHSLFKSRVQPASASVLHLGLEKI